MKLKVIAECVDRRTGTRYFEGGFFPGDDEDQVSRLTIAGCLKAVADDTLTEEEAAAAKVTREEADAEIAAISFALVDARQRRDETLAAISDEIGKARSDADSEILRIKQEVADMQEQKAKDLADFQRRQINEDGLFERTVDELKDLAKSEDIDLGSATKKEAIITAIRVARSEKEKA